MTGTGWASLCAAVVLVILLVVVVLDSRSARQRARNGEGTITGLQLDLDAARERIEQLQTYLSDYDSWATNPAKPVPAHLANRTPPDRWSSATNDERVPPTAGRKLSDAGQVQAHPIVWSTTSCICARNLADENDSACARILLDS